MRLLRLLVFVLFLVATLPASAQLALDGADAAVSLTPLAHTVSAEGEVALFAGAAPGVSYTGITLQGRTADHGLTGEARFEQADGTWTDWQPLYLIFLTSAGETFVGSYRGDAVWQGRMEIRLRTAMGRPVSLMAVGVFDGRTGPDLQPSSVAPLGADATVTPSGRIKPPRVVNRKKWRAADYRGTPSPLAPSPDYLYVTIHHTAGDDATTQNQAMETLRSIQQFHQNGRGWDDIGYQFLMDDLGTIYQGRPYYDGVDLNVRTAPALAMGAHAGNANTANVGISLLGCYNTSGGCNDTVTPATFDSLATFIAFLMETYKVSADNLRGHRNFSATDCPGHRTYALFDSLETRVRRILRDGNTATSTEALPSPTDYALAEAWPNPFTDATTIRYALQQPGTVRLDVYDVTGRRVQTLTEGYREANHWHTARFDAADLPAGMYFYRLRAESGSGLVFDQTKKLVLVR